jgi:phenylacetate-CoA ligase
LGKLDQLYSRLPVPAQHLAVTAFGAYWYWLRFGPGFAKSVRGYRDRDRLSPSDWNAWQEARLRRLLTAAADRVSYYQAHWTEAEKAAARSGRLQALPLLEKDPVRADPFAFVREDLRPRRPLIFHTSGSTGTPVASIWTAGELRHSMAFREARSAGWAGVSFAQPRSTFSGRLVEPDPQSKGPFYRFNYVERQAYLSAFHLRPDTAPLYVEALRRRGIVWMTGYAVSHYLLASFMLEQRLSVSGLKAVITTSEKLTPAMRTVMQAAFGCRVYEEYSTVENSVFASECEHGRLHSSPDVSVLEILRSNGEPCLPGEPGEVVATCLFRDLQPLLRYRLGDMAAWDPEPCPCGRGMPVIREVLGRVEDVVIGPDGRRMVRFHGIFVDQPHVREGQIIQERIDRIRVKVVPTSGWGEADVQDVVSRVRQRLGPGVEVVVEPVQSIPRSAAGKFQAVISRLREQGVAAAERTGTLPASEGADAGVPRELEIRP